VLATGPLEVGLASARMQIVRRRSDSDATEGREATPAHGVLAFLVIAFFGLPGAFALRLSL